MPQQATRSAADTRPRGPAILQELEDFSLVLGGPTFQLLRKARLQGGEADLVSRRIFAITLITWLPLFVLAMLGSAGDDALLGAADIQSLADLGNSYSLVRDMRSFPFGLEDVSRLAIATAVPLLPLLLTVFSPEDLLARVIQVVF